MPRQSKAATSDRIKSLTGPKCPMRRSSELPQLDGVNMLSLLIGGDATVDDLERFADGDRTYSRNPSNVSKCARAILAGECAVYGIQGIELPDMLTEDVDTEDVEGLAVLGLIEDTVVVNEIKAVLAVGPIADINEMGPHVVPEDAIYG